MLSPTVGLLLLTTALVCFLVLFLLYNVREFDDKSGDDRGRKTTELTGGSQSEMQKRDCDQETVYSVLDSQCHAVCKQPGVFGSRNGACVNVLAFRADDDEDGDASKKCDPRRGVMAFLVGDTQFGGTKMRCYSVDPGIQPDDPQRQNIICNHGSVDIDYVRSFPQPGDCRCTDPTRSVLALVANTKEVRQYGVCVSEEMSRLYRHDELLHDSALSVM